MHGKRTLGIVTAVSSMLLAAPAAAQSIVIVAVCAASADFEPTLAALDVGAGAVARCEMPGEEDAAYCAAVAGLELGAHCADALGTLLDAGAVLRSVETLADDRPPPTDAAAARPPGGEIVYSRIASSGRVRIVGCEFGDSGPRARFVQDSHAPPSSGESCATALESAGDEPRGSAHQRRDRFSASGDSGPESDRLARLGVDSAGSRHGSRGPPSPHARNWGQQGGRCCGCTSQSRSDRARADRYQPVVVLDPGHVRVLHLRRFRSGAVAPTRRRSQAQASRFVTGPAGQPRSRCDVPPVSGPLAMSVLPRTRWG